MPISAVSEIDLSHPGIGLRHKPADKQGRYPQQEPEDRGSQILGAEDQCSSQKTCEHHHLTVSAHEQVFSIARPV